MLTAFSRRRPLIIAAVLIVSACAGKPPAEAVDLPQTVVYASQDLPEQIGLARLLTYAGQHHPDILAADARVERASAAVSTAASWADPNLGVSVGLDNSDWKTLSLEQEIPSFGRRSLSIEQARAALDNARAKRWQVQAEVALRVTQAYAEYAYILADQAVQQQGHDLLQQMADITRSRYETGQARLDEWLQAQNHRDQSHSDLAVLGRLQTAAGTRLNAALGRSRAAKLPQLPDFDEALAHMPEIGLDEDALHNLMAEQNPKLEASRHQLDSLAAGKRLSERNGLPRFMLGVQYMDMGGMNSGTTSAMASMTLPIWRSSYRAAEDAADADYRAATAQQHSLKLDLQAQLAMAVYRQQQADENSKLYGQVLLPRAQQAMASVLENYRHGDKSFSDVLASQQEWLNFSLNYQRSLADLLLSRAEILLLVHGKIEVSDED